jgi:electron transfer flavoprotein beta subunit
MNIVVLVKQVPDSGAERTLSASDNSVERSSADNVINEMDEYAIEEALKIKEAHGGEVTILTMGPERAAESIRKALSMGPDKAVHVSDDALHGSCAVATSKVLAAALGTLNADVIICGAESTDGRVQVMPHMLAERLGIAALTGARKLTVDGSQLTAERQTDEGSEVVTALQRHHGGQEEAGHHVVAERPGHRRRRGRQQRRDERGGRLRQAAPAVRGPEGHR